MHIFIIITIKETVLVLSILNNFSVIISEMNKPVEESKRSWYDEKWNYDESRAKKREYFLTKYMCVSELEYIAIRT